MNLIAKAHRIQHTAQLAIAGEWCTYTDGHVSIRARMVRGSSQFENVTAEGEVRTEARVADFLVAADKLITDAGEPVTPRAGDQVLPDAGGTYELIPGPNGVPYDWEDSHETRYRLHADKISNDQ